MCCNRQTGIILKDYDIQEASNTTAVTKLIDGAMIPGGLVSVDGGLRITVNGKFTEGNSSRTCQVWVRLNGVAAGSNIITVPAGSPFFTAIATYFPDDSYTKTVKNFMSFTGDQLPSGSDASVGVDGTELAVQRMNIDFSDDVEFDFEVQNSDTTLSTEVHSYMIELL